MTDLPDKFEYKGRQWTRTGDRWMRKFAVEEKEVVFKDGAGNMIRLPASTTLGDLMRKYNVKEVRISE